MPLVLKAAFLFVPCLAFLCLRRVSVLFVFEAMISSLYIYVIYLLLAYVNKLSKMNDSDIKTEYLSQWCEVDLLSIWPHFGKRNLNRIGDLRTPNLP